MLWHEIVWKKIDEKIENIKVRDRKEKAESPTAFAVYAFVKLASKEASKCVRLLRGQVVGTRNPYY